MTAPDPIALAAAARRLAEAATPGPWAHPGGRLVMGGEHFQALSPLWRSEADAAFIAAARTLVPALADAVEALVREREAWQRATGCVDPLTISDALARIGRILGKTPTEGIPDAAERLVAERDEARAETTSHFRELLAAQHEKNAALSRAEDAEADRKRLTAELAEARAETARAVAVEREACAVAVEDTDDVRVPGWDAQLGDATATRLAAAAAIRARGGA